MFRRSPEGDGDGRHEGGAKKAVKNRFGFIPALSPTIQGRERSEEEKPRAERFAHQASEAERSGGT